MNPPITVEVNKVDANKVDVNKQVLIMLASPVVRSAGLRAAARRRSTRAGNNGQMRCSGVGLPTTKAHRESDLRHRRRRKYFFDGMSESAARRR